jgi:predicted TIM-barrel fold metal-dependent hydrolase
MLVAGRIRRKDHFAEYHATNRKGAMLTRRDLLTGAIIVGVLNRDRTVQGNEQQQATELNFDVPAGACDCHTHIFGDPQTFPMSSLRSYTPEPASPEDLVALHRRLSIQRVVIVTPSIYGSDNATTVFGIKSRGVDARGIAVIDDQTPEGELDALGLAGVCGIRLNLATANVNEPDAARRRFQTAAERMKTRKWHIQILTNAPLIADLQQVVSASPVPVVFDHFGGAQAAGGTSQPGFAELIGLVRSARAYVKISGAYRASQRAPDYAEVAPFAKALIAANPDRVVWGTDWPHPDAAPKAGRIPTDISPALPIDDVRLLNELAVWAPDSAIRKKILVENPARLYGF